ncbi:MAG: glutathione S-transferase N-terminal domain-containing protein [Pseudomonadota bacterium]
MIRFLYNMAPNPMKVALFLEESGLDYELVPIETRKAEQHTDTFKALNPNAKLPVLTDGDAVIFDSNAILLYLAEKSGQFLPAPGDKERGALLSWLMFVASGLGPFSGQAVHFRNFAPEKIHYAIKRYDFEARRHWQIIDDRLGQGRYMLGETYTIIDMAVWGWGDRLTYMLGDDDIMQKYPNLDRLMQEIEARPAAIRARAIKDNHEFQQEFDEVALRSLYPQLFAPDPVY